MKLKHLFTQHQRGQVVRQFGQARLIRLAQGEHELVGGSDADRAAAFEWASLFAHEIVFTHSRREPQPPCRPRRNGFPVRLSCRW